MKFNNLNHTGLFVCIAAGLFITSTWLHADSTAEVETASGKTTAAVTAVADAEPPQLSYSYLCYGVGGAGNAWEKTTCYPPGTSVGADENTFSTGNDNTDPYSGTLDPNQKLQLTIQCGWEKKVSGVTLKKNDIKCNSSQKEKGTKIYQCHNKSDSSHHTWELKKYQCPQG